jgi:hypothetical protein
MRRGGGLSRKEERGGTVVVKGLVGYAESDEKI